MQKNSPQKILVVDDEPSDRILLRKILSKNYIITLISLTNDCRIVKNRARLFSCDNVTFCLLTYLPSDT